MFLQGLGRPRLKAQWLGMSGTFRGLISWWWEVKFG